MKALLLGGRTYTSKKTGEVSTTGAIVYMRPDGSVEVKQLFGFDITKFRAGMIVSVDFDPNGFLMSMNQVSESESFPLMLDELV